MLSLEEQNIFIQNLLKDRVINANIITRLFQQFINKHESFSKELVAYFKELEKELDLLTDDKKRKLYVFQLLSELGSLVFPNISRCYSFFFDLKKIDWRNIIRKFHKRLKEQSDDQKLLLLDNNFKKLTCLV
mgnify:CR=1 FL=1